MRLRRKARVTKLDRRRQRSRDRYNGNTDEHRAFDALGGNPWTWPPGEDGERREWRGDTWIFHSGGCRVIYPGGLFRDVPYAGWFRDVP